MLRGVDILAKAVSVTLGPKGSYYFIAKLNLLDSRWLIQPLTLLTGRNVIIEQPYGGPKITKGMFVSFSPSAPVFS